ncbi:MAG: xylulokinase [Spirochaetaceae bacterium]|nr:MAG: xylulokinase [Spirochaetaceae bacterium]
MESFIGIDTGTSSIKVCLIDGAGRVQALASDGYRLAHPGQGWAEQDPEVWWTALTRAVGSLRQRVGAGSLRDVQAIGLTGQMHTLVVLGGDGIPLRPAISWTDQRTVAECDYLRRNLLEEVFACTSNPPSTGYTLPKLLWIRNHEPEVYRRICALVLPKDYIRYRLTGEIATDYCDASATLLFDPVKLQWSHQLASTLGIDRSILPPVRNATDLGGVLTDSAARLLELRAGLPVYVGSGDVAAGWLASGANAAATAAGLSLGSGALFVAPSGSPTTDPHRRLNLLCDGTAGRWLVMAAIQNAGIAVDWYLVKILQELLPDRGASERPDYNTINARVTSVAAGAGGVLFLPYLTGERTPHMDENAAGVFFGLRSTHTGLHLYRAVLEGIAYALRDALEVVKSLDLPADPIVAGGGGAANKALLAILASVLERRLVVSPQTDASVLGAALYALHGSDPSRLRGIGGADAPVSIEPDQGDIPRYRSRFAVYQNLYASLKQSFEQSWDDAW